MRSEEFVPSYTPVALYVPDSAHPQIRAPNEELAARPGIDEVGTFAGCFRTWILLQLPDQEAAEQSVRNGPHRLWSAINGELYSVAFSASIQCSDGCLFSASQVVIRAAGLDVAPSNCGGPFP